MLNVAHHGHLASACRFLMLQQPSLGSEGARAHITIDNVDTLQAHPGSAKPRLKLKKLWGCIMGCELQLRNKKHCGEQMKHTYRSNVIWRA